MIVYVQISGDAFKLDYHENRYTCRLLISEMSSLEDLQLPSRHEGLQHKSLSLENYFGNT